MAKANDILNLAIKEIGVKEYPSNSNKVKYNTLYYGYEVQGQAYPWCCVFIWWLFKQANASKIFYDGKKVAYCPYVEKWGKANNLTVDKTKGKPGDIILFDFKGNGVSAHIGIIEKMENNQYICIEGNTSSSSDDNGGAVMRRTRPLSVVRCIIRPKYEAEVAPAPSIDTTPDDIKEVQAYLNFKISAGLVVDGSYGPLSRKALIKYWQKTVGGLDVDGSFGPKSRAAASKHNLSKGSKGELVRIMQMALICKGYSMGSYGADASFGGTTYNKLIAFQRAKGLSADGICGKNTWTELFK